MQSLDAVFPQAGCLDILTPCMFWTSYPFVVFLLSSLPCSFSMGWFFYLSFLFLTSVDDLFDDSRNERGVIVAVAA